MTKMRMQEPMRLDREVKYLSEVNEEEHDHTPKLCLTKAEYDSIKEEMSELTLKLDKAGMA